MIKKLVLFMLLVTPVISPAAQQTWNSGDPLSEVRTKIQANDTDLYAQAATKWLTGTAYTADNQAVVHNGNIYVCVTSHTAGTFATDLAASRWKLWGADIYSPSALTTVRTTAGGGSTTAPPAEAAVGDALALKQNSADVIEADTDGTTLCNNASSPLILSICNAGVGPTQLATSVNTNSIQWVYVDTTATETEGFPVRIPTGAAWTNAYSSCNGNEATLVYTLERATTLGGGMSSLGTIAHNSSASGDTIDISGFTDPSSGDWVQVRITTAATTATACTLALELISN